ncbi:MAG: CheA signal transduction histidine kinase [Polaromonas sp.]|nr:CheA signal transduction histidine kinase [Polaromonas sp.]
MHSMATTPIASEPDVAMNDLGPLAWVLDELRKSLESASKALKRFTSDASLARGSDLAAIDASQLRIARQQLHQAVGALEVIGLVGPALVLRAMEAAVQKFVQQPELCNQDAVAKIEYASFALTEYLEGVLADKPVSAVSLFPQYRDVQELVRAERIHPADLWSYEWRWQEPQLSVLPKARHYDSEARAVLDQSVLQLMKGGAPQAAQNLRDLSLGFAANQIERQPRIFWLIAAGYFEAVAHNLLSSDLYVKRAASRILLQYSSLAKGDTSISERLALDLLFFCVQAVAKRVSNTPVLSAVRLAYRLTQFKPVDYELVQFGRFDPALLAQARKRIVLAKDAWSSLCAGDISKIKLVADQFSLVTDSLRKLHAASEPLAQALTQAIEVTVHTGQAPAIPLAMEVATSILYLEAVFDDLDPADPKLAIRTASLAERLEGVRNGGEPQPLEAWMEELYRRVSDKQTMGSVVSELRVSLNELEGSLDLFFRNPKDKTSLQPVPGQLSQMRGVLSVLGLDQASRAVLHMKNSVEKLLAAEIDLNIVQSTGTFDHFGNNLGALSFLIDMLDYQPALAKKLFVYDEEKDELKPMMGRSQNTGTAASTITVNNEPLPEFNLREAEILATAETVTKDIEHSAIPAELPMLVQAKAVKQETILELCADTKAATPNSATVPAVVSIPAAPVDQLTSMDFEEDDLRDIFLEEAREVAVNAVEAIQTLASDPEDSEQLTVLRRAFHTLKGSARMVGLGEFGEAAWAMEQLLNSWLADQKTPTKEFRNLCFEVITGFEGWIADIASSQDGKWLAAPFCKSAEAMRIEGQYITLNLSETAINLLASSASAAVPAVEDRFQANADRDAAMEFDIISNSKHTSASVDATVEQERKTGTELDEFDFDDLFAQSDDIEALSVAMESAQPIKLPEAEFEKYLETEIAGSVADADGILKINVPGESEFALAAEAAKHIDDGKEDAVKIIDGLRIGLPLYNVYLNEADEWSRRLANEIAEWALESHQPISASTVAFAHSLAGSSATVGFIALSEMARSLEHALENSRNHHNHGASAYGQLFIEAAEDIRRLLHQFAAGFLKQPQPDILDRLNKLEFADSVLPQTYEETAVELVSESTQTAGENYAVKVAKIPETQAVPIPEAKPLVVIQSVQASVLAEKVMVSASVKTVGIQLHDDLNDDIDAVDAIDPDLFPIFEEECAELMPRLGSALRQWAESPAGQGPRLEVLRVLHTLKGSARLAGAMRLGEMAHRIESEIAFVSSESASSQEFEPMMTRFDRMQTAFEGLRHSDTAGAQVLPVTMVDAVPIAVIESATDKVNILKSEVANKKVAKDAAGASDTVHVNSDVKKIEIPAPQGMVMQPLRQAANASIRVRTQLLDRMVNQAGEVMITRSRLEAEIGQLRISLNDMTGSLVRLRQQLRDVELQAETQMQSRLALAKEAQAGFDPLEFDRFTRVQELTRMMAESVNDVATVQRTLQRTIEATEDDLIAQSRQTRELQRDLLRTRMVEFESVSERLYRVVRQASKETGKQVRLDLLGGSLEMDRGMLDRMMPAFEHLLRNCVTHGIEAPQVRMEAGKEPVGLITIHVRQEGNDVSVEFSDDGAGLDLVRIRKQGIRLGLVTADQVADAEAAANLIFLPGFSTAEEVTELAGRGIGMDVVRTDVLGVGGRIKTSTVAGKGTHFTLVLPLTTAVTQVVMIRAGTMSVGVPANVVEMVRRLPVADLQQAYRTGMLDFGGEAVPFFWSGALLQASHSSSEPQGKHIPVVIFRSAAQRIAMHVDEVLGNREVVVKNLGPQLSGLPGLTGMSVLPSGAVVLIYNPVALSAVYGEQARAWTQERMGADALGAPGRKGTTISDASATPKLPLILVVDDSITVRRVTQRLLLRDGYRVAMAADGLQALERLQEELPAVVLSDIEMPRMDGFDLARNIRGDERTKDLPIIMITSRIAGKHNEHAMELGVNHYLGKPYSEDELLRLVRHYCSLKTEVMA